MFTESQTAKAFGQTDFVAPGGLTVQQALVRRYSAASAQFLAVVVQFGLITLIVGDWQLENLSVSRLMDLAFAGFIVHHLLPLRFRLPFFAMLSLAAVVLGVGEIGTRMFVAGLSGKLPLRDFVYPMIPGLGLAAVGLG